MLYENFVIARPWEGEGRRETEKARGGGRAEQYYDIVTLHFVISCDVITLEIIFFLIELS